MKSFFRIILLLIVAGCLSVFLLHLRRSKSAPEEQQALVETPDGQESLEQVEAPFLSPENGFLPPRFTQADHVLQNDPGKAEDLPEEATRLKDLTQSEQSAMSDIHTLIGSCGMIANQGALPTGLNVEITNVLLGENYRKIAYLPDSHSRINKNGELIDKWGTPYDFHSISTKRIEITSAGPDKEFDTNDDIKLDVE